MSHLVQTGFNADIEQFNKNSILELSVQTDNYNDILLSRENIDILKCKKKKNKFKKYKLRKDGLVDPDVLDVSNIFHISLKIKSPRKDDKENILHNQEDGDYDELKVTNYLFKMARHKRKQNKLQETKNAVEELTHMTENERYNGPNDGDRPVSVAESEIKTAISKNTNAFVVMMSSRNKSIGTNSPGKEKPQDDLDFEEKSELKAVKLRRTLALQKMAEKNGSIHKKILEENVNECINKKMEKRAERLKKMLVNAKPSKHATDNITINNHTNDEEAVINNHENKALINSSETKNVKTQVTCTQSYRSKIVSIIDEDIFTFNSVNQKQVSQEEDEFQKKLSPSLKKRNMLSYFKKVDKDVQSDQKDENNIEVDREDNSIVEIKLTSKNTNKTNKMKKNRHTVTKVKEISNKEKGCVLSASSADKIMKCLPDEVEEVKTNKKKENNIIKEKVSRNNVNHHMKKEGQTKVVKSKLVTVVNSENKIILQNTNKDKSDNSKSNITNVTLSNNKRKRRKSSQSSFLTNEANTSSTTESRPKRNVKQPQNYADLINLSSSDEELHIFTPKKKKIKESLHKLQHKKESKLSHEYIGEKLNNIQKKSRREDKFKNLKPKQNKELVLVDNKTAVKLAPLFVSKPQLDATLLEARQKFLHSGVPEKIKKIQMQEKKVIYENIFFITKHVCQGSNNIPNGNSSFIDYYPAELVNMDFETVGYCDNDYSVLIFPNESIDREKNGLPFTNNIKLLLQDIKRSYPEFPVYRTYRLLKNKFNTDVDAVVNVYVDNSSELINISCTDNTVEDPMHLTWTEKYRQTFAKDVIGNFEGIKEIRKWLLSWQENEMNSQRNGSDSDSSDFFYYSDTDSRDSMKCNNNLLIVTGPIGSGKTSNVYAVAAELAIKVIEVNASNRRTGKIMLQDLQEATQSHKVNRSQAMSSENPQNPQENLIRNLNKKKIKLKKSASNKKLLKRHETLINSESLSQPSASSQSGQQTKMSLILIDDADIIFDQDDGFTAALSQIIQCSKRPVILITSTMTCFHLQKFMHCPNIVKMHPLPARMLGTWLDIMCLADSGLCLPGLGRRCLEFYKGDIRKAVNYLHFLVSSHANMTKDNNSEDIFGQEQKLSLDVEEECSSSSWVDCNINKAKQEATFSGADSFKDHQILSYFKPCPTLWWNMSGILFASQQADSGVILDLAEEKSIETSELAKMANIIDNFSLSDILWHGRKEEDCIASDPWRMKESDSVSELENTENYSKNNGILEEMSETLIMKSVFGSKPLFDEEDVDYCLPDSNTQRVLNKVVSRHHSLTDSVSTSAILDRRALSLDYWSTCRTICRTERNKIESNSKRNHRFYHYLKSIKVTCNNDSFEKLCDSLCPEEK